MREHRDVLIVFVAVALHAVSLIPYVQYTPDDTFIHLQFAKNLVAGHGFSFNAGEPTYGSTSPLWVLTLSLFGFFSKSLLTLSKVLGVLFALGSIVLFFPLAKEFNEDRRFVCACVIVWSVDAWFLRWAPSGMETALALFLLVLALLLYVRERRVEKRFFLSPVLFGLLTLVRPEAALLFGLSAVDAMCLGRRSVWRIVVSVATYAAILAPWFLFAQFEFGTVVPNTFIAKGGSVPVDLSTWFASALKATETVVSNQLMEMLLVLAGAVFIVKQHGFQFEFYKRSVRHFLAAAWVVLLPSVYVISGLPIVSRYLLLITPPLILLAFLALSTICLHLRLRRSIVSALVTGVVIMIVAQNTVVSWSVIRPHVRSFERAMKECFIPIGQWFAEETPSETVIAARDIGALGYYSERKVVDLGGLVTPEVHPWLKEYSPEELTDRYPSLGLQLPRADYIVYRSKTEDKIGDVAAFYDPIFTKSVASLGISDTPGETYYTVCRITWHP